MEKKQIIARICALVEEREDWTQTLNIRKNDEEFLHTYHVVEREPEFWVILSEYYDRITNERQFLIYDLKKDKLREATVEEDEKYREIDDELPYREDEEMCDFVIARDPDNSIVRHSDTCESRGYHDWMILSVAGTLPNQELELQCTKCGVMKKVDFKYGGG